MITLNALRTFQHPVHCIRSELLVLKASVGNATFEENERMVVQGGAGLPKGSGIPYATERGVARNCGTDRQLTTLGQFPQLLFDLRTRSARIENAKN